MTGTHHAAWIEEARALVVGCGGVGGCVAANLAHAGRHVVTLTGNAEIAIPLEGLIDFEKERGRLKGQLEKLDTELQRLNGQLSNANFVEKAPKEKVDELRVRKSELESQIATLRDNLDSIN